ncbi:MAG: 6-pyruvoyl tetrahydropterin synthase family protein [Rhodothermales bacterium]
MYKLSIKEEFVAQHFLTVPDCGPENVLHSHVYALEVLLQGSELDQYGYLTDIDVVKGAMDEILNRYRDHTLNDDPAFAGLNPSIEHFSRIVCLELVKTLKQTNLEHLAVRIWEDKDAYASYETSL